MNGFKLTLTGTLTASGRFVVLIDEQRIALPESRYLCLLVLLFAKIFKSNCCATLEDFANAGVTFDKSSLHQCIKRVRSDFDVTLGPASGKQLVLHEGRSRYSVAIDTEAFHVDQAFRDLGPELPTNIFVRLASLISDPELPPAPN